MREWKELNADAWTAYMKAWDESHPGYKEQWAQDNADAMREYGRKWREQNIERARDYSRRHRAHKLAAPSENFDSASVFERDAGLCGICSEPVDPNDWHLDHIHPLSKGGHHTLDNVQIAHPRCNRKKGAKVLATIEGSP
jgi:5-methylcytosine-specific restriction endonuclease McrA